MFSTTLTKSLTLSDVREVLDGVAFCSDDLSSKTIRGVGAADLMSDVLALSEPGMLLLTGLVNAQVIRTAIVADLAGVVFVRGRKPGEEMLDLARESGIPLMGTQLTMFEAAGRLYRLVMAGVDGF
jgi:hypothetical protein